MSIRNGITRFRHDVTVRDVAEKVRNAMFKWTASTRHALVLYQHEAWEARRAVGLRSKVKAVQTCRAVGGDIEVVVFAGTRAIDFDMHSGDIVLHKHF